MFCSHFGSRSLFDSLLFFDMDEITQINRIKRINLVRRFRFRTGFEVPPMDLSNVTRPELYGGVRFFKNHFPIDKIIFDMLGPPLPSQPHPLALIVATREMQIFFLLKFRNQSWQGPIYPPGHRLLASQQRIVRNTEWLEALREFNLRRNIERRQLLLNPPPAFALD